MNRIASLWLTLCGALFVIGAMPSDAAAVAMVQAQAQLKVNPVEPNWARYPASCQHPTLMSCGSLGKFQLKEVSAVPGCTQIQSGASALSPYPRQLSPNLPGFPPPTTAAYLQSAILNSYSGTLQSSTTVSTSNAAIEAGQDWIAVVDFDDSHGWSTRHLAAETAGDGFESMLVPLELDESDPLGAVTNDFHVLRALCSIVEQMESPSVAAPSVVNMSFGRIKQPNETWYEPDCVSSRFACQIARVLGEIRAQGARIVGAAGNHGEMLFPAGLSSVTSVGMLDLHSLRYGSQLAPVWHSPDGADAILPGGQLCIDGDWPAPAGTSYSSAMFSGWLAQVGDRMPGDESGRLSPWMPVWDEDMNCYLLSDGETSIPECSPGVDSHIQRLDGTLENPCWEGSGAAAASATFDNGAPPPEDLPSFDHWADAVLPTPSGDPCVPCVGLQRDTGLPEEVLEINLSDSPGLDPTVYIVAVYLKSAAGFEEIPLTPAELAALRAGTLDQLDLTDFTLEIPEFFQPSLWYLISTEPSPDCFRGDLCFWDSSSILVELEGF